jgi:hypothetical protein
MAFDEALAERIRQALSRRKHVEEKKMFGGIGFLRNGHLLVGVWKDSLIVRLGGEQGEEALKEPHVSEFNITGRAMKGWVLVEPDSPARGPRHGRPFSLCRHQATSRLMLRGAAVCYSSPTAASQEHSMPPLTDW